MKMEVRIGSRIVERHKNEASLWLQLSKNSHEKDVNVHSYMYIADPHEHD